MQLRNSLAIGLRGNAIKELWPSAMQLTAHSTYENMEVMSFKDFRSQHM